MAGPYTSTIPSGLTDWSSSLVFPKFDSSLGTLTSVQFELSSGMSTTVTVQNDGNSTSSGWAKTEVILTVQDPNGYFGSPQIDYMSPAYDFVLDPNQTATSGTLTKTSSDSWIYSDAGTLAEFTGSGNISLSAATLTYTVLSYTGGNAAAVQVTDAQATGKITYFYDVPEPATLSLLAVSGLAMLRRRK
ncbi:MAG: PEP-CTERM sorting domain-containing protein [Phycisphaerae bacterium]